MMQNVSQGTIVSRPPRVFARLRQAENRSCRLTLSLPISTSVDRDQDTGATVGEMFGTETFCHFLYSIVRMDRPSVVVELGCGGAATTLMVCKALSENGSGHCWTIDNGADWKLEYVRRACQSPLGTYDAEETYGDFVRRLLARVRYENVATLVEMNLDASHLFDPGAPIDILFADALPSNVEGCLAVLRYDLPRVALYSSIFIDRAGTIHHSRLFLQYIVDRLNHGKIPWRLIDGLEPEQQQALQQSGHAVRLSTDQPHRVEAGQAQQTAEQPRLDQDSAGRRHSTQRRRQLWLHHAPVGLINRLLGFGCTADVTIWAQAASVPRSSSVSTQGRLRCAPAARRHRQTYTEAEQSNGDRFWNRFCNCSGEGIAEHPVRRAFIRLPAIDRILAVERGDPKCGQDPYGRGGYRVWWPNWRCRLCGSGVRLPGSLLSDAVGFSNRRDGHFRQEKLGASDILSDIARAKSSTFGQRKKADERQRSANRQKLKNLAKDRERRQTHEKGFLGLPASQPASAHPSGELRLRQALVA